MKKLKVIEFQGLAPSVFCGLYFADQGAQVIFVARAEAVPVSMPFNQNILNRNKKCIQINFKNKEQFGILKELLKTADIVIDPYRPGVLQKLQIGPKDLQKLNKGIILLRVSGYGQTGSFRLKPGHDLNYLAVGGIIPLLNRSTQYQFPTNYMADFVSASLGITGVLGALHERQKTGRGGVVDCSLADGCTYFAQNMRKFQNQQKVPLIKTVKIDTKEYILTGAERQKLSKAQILQLLQGQSYYRSKTSDLQISEVKSIENFDPNVLENPFSKQTVSKILRMKGENNSQVFNQYRPKL